jgi:hypothetical protein
MNNELITILAMPKFIIHLIGATASPAAFTDIVNAAQVPKRMAEAPFCRIYMALMEPIQLCNTTRVLNTANLDSSASRICLLYQPDSVSIFFFYCKVSLAREERL